jgi:hypothetical protein
MKKSKFPGQVSTEMSGKRVLGSIRNGLRPFLKIQNKQFRNKLTSELEKEILLVLCFPETRFLWSKQAFIQNKHNSTGITIWKYFDLSNYLFSLVEIIDIQRNLVKDIIDMVNYAWFHIIWTFDVCLAQPSEMKKDWR